MRGKTTNRPLFSFRILNLGREKNCLHGRVSSIPFFNFLSFSFLCFHGGKPPTSLRSISSSRALAGLQKIMDVAKKDIKSFIFETRTRWSGLDMATSSFSTLSVDPCYYSRFRSQSAKPGFWTHKCLPLLNGTVLIEFMLLQMAAASTAQRFCNLLNAPEYKRFDCLSVVKRRRKMRDVSTAFVARVCAL
jgi:hypothetical protein